MAHIAHRLEGPRFRRRSRSIGWPSAADRPVSGARLSLPEALAHELNNPLSIAMMEVAELKASGHDVAGLDYALQRIQAVGAELGLPERVKRISKDRLELNQAFGIVQELLGSCASRVDTKLPTAIVLLEPLSLCHLLHTLLIAHLDASSNERVRVEGHAKGGRIVVVITGGERSPRVRTSLLAIALDHSTSAHGEAPHVLAAHLAEALAVECTLDAVPSLVQTRFALPVATTSGIA